MSLEGAVDLNTRAALQSTASEAGARYIDPMGFLCGDDNCPAIAGDVLIYRDANHLTPAFVQLLAPYIERTLDGVVRGHQGTA